MDPRLEAYLKICREIYERKVRDGTWPWPEDSPNSGDVIDSESNSDDL